MNKTQPKKRFGQHFLHDPAIIERILDTLAPAAGEVLVEIGPGRGALSLPLLRRGHDLIAIELDGDLIAALRAAAATCSGRLHLLHADALGVDYSALAGDAAPLRVFGNLPYNVATELMFRLLGHLRCIGDMLFMVQREVAERIGAEPGTAARGRLSVMLQTWCACEQLFIVRPGAFTPPPAVDSALMRLRPLPQPALGASREQTFTELVRRAFAQRRKTLRNNLRGLLDPEDIAVAGADPGTRPQTLTQAQFVRLAEVLQRRRDACTARGEAAE